MAPATGHSLALQSQPALLKSPPQAVDWPSSIRPAAVRPDEQRSLPSGQATSKAMTVSGNSALSPPLAPSDPRGYCFTSHTQPDWGCSSRQCEPNPGDPLADAPPALWSSVGWGSHPGLQQPTPCMTEPEDHHPALPDGLWTPWHGNRPVSSDACSPALHEPIQACHNRGSASTTEQEVPASFLAGAHPMLKSRHGSSVSLFSDGEPADDCAAPSGYCPQRHHDPQPVDGVLSPAHLEQLAGQLSGIRISPPHSYGCQTDSSPKGGAETGNRSCGASSPPSSAHSSRPGSLDIGVEPQQPCSHASAVQEATRHLWLGNIPLKPNRAAIENMFGSFGRLETVRVFPGKTYAFVNFVDVDAAARAKSALDGATLPAITGSRAIILRFQSDTDAAAAAAKQEAKSGSLYASQPNNPLFGKGRPRLSNCLNPNNTCFDPELAECYRRMSKHDKELLWSYERQVNGGGKGCTEQPTREEPQMLPSQPANHSRSASGSGLYGSSVDSQSASPPAAASWFAPSSSPQAAMSHLPVQKYVCASDAFGPGATTTQPATAPSAFARIAHSAGQSIPPMADLRGQLPLDVQAGAHLASLLAHMPLPSPCGVTAQDSFLPSSAHLSDLQAILSAPGFCLPQATFGSVARPAPPIGGLVGLMPERQHHSQAPPKSAAAPMWLHS